MILMTCMSYNNMTTCHTKGANTFQRVTSAMPRQAPICPAYTRRRVPRGVALTHARLNTRPVSLRPVWRDSGLCGVMMSTAVCGGTPVCVESRCRYYDVTFDGLRRHHRESHASFWLGKPACSTSGKHTGTRSTVKRDLKVIA